MRAIVQFGRSATGSSSKGVTTRNAVFALHRRRPGRDARFQGVHAAPAEIAAPQPNRVFAHAERLGDPRTGPTRKRQQHGARPVRLPAITRPRKGRQRTTPVNARRNRRLATHAAPVRIGANSESQNPRVGQSTGICLAATVLREFLIDLSSLEALPTPRAFCGKALALETFTSGRIATA